MPDSLAASAFHSNIASPEIFTATCAAADGGGRLGQGSRLPIPEADFAALGDDPGTDLEPNTRGAACNDSYPILESFGIQSRLQ